MSGLCVFAHENVRKQMTVDHFLAAFNSTTPASPESALPVVTFTESVTFHWNGDEIRVFHVDPAHTNGETKIIPGHGELASRMELERYYEMLVTARDLIKEHVDAGKTRDEVIAAKPTETVDATWGGGFLSPDMWVGIVYDGMTASDH